MDASAEKMSIGTVWSYNLARIRILSLARRQQVSQLEQHAADNHLLTINTDIQPTVNTLCKRWCLCTLSIPACGRFMFSLSTFIHIITVDWCVDTSRSWTVSQLVFWWSLISRFVFFLPFSVRWTQYRRPWSTTPLGFPWWRPRGRSSRVTSARSASTQRYRIRNTQKTHTLCFCLHLL